MEARKNKGGWSDGGTRKLKKPRGMETVGNI
jgi:hypothetical protein